MPGSVPAPSVARATVGVLRETYGGETRVAVVPASVAKLLASGFDVLVELGAGAGAWFDDASYVAAGAEVLPRAEVLARATVCVGIHPPPADDLHSGQAVLGLLQPGLNADLMGAYAARGVTALSFDGLPRTLSRAQSMDVLTSQASIAGYKAALVAADTFPGYLPMMMTATGTVRPAKVLVLGGGVAGLQAMGTALRLGAVVKGYDVRAAARGDIESVGATFVTLDGAADAEGAGGYARQLTAEEAQAQQAALQAVVVGQDIVISTAQVPGRKPPVLVTAAAHGAMRPGSVVIDLAASSLGGNVAGSIPRERVTTPRGITIVGAGDLPALMPTAASTAYASSVQALLAHLWPAEGFRLDLTDEIQQGVLVTYDHRLTHAVPPIEEHAHELYPVQ